MFWVCKMETRFTGGLAGLPGDELFLLRFDLMYVANNNRLWYVVPRRSSSFLDVIFQVHRLILVQMVQFDPI